MKADSKTEAAVMSVLNRFKEAVAKRDTTGALELFATDLDVLCMGSEAGEIAVGRSELKALLKRVLSRPTAYYFEWRSHSVSSTGSVSWATIDALVHAKGEGQEIALPYRITAVLERRGNKWLLMHYHGSEPAHH